MTCRRPTISVRLAVLERLAQANRDDSHAPDSMEFDPVSWREIERTSFTDGLNDLLAYQEERVAEEEREKLEVDRRQALERARQHAEARRWEQQQIERARAERLERQIEHAKTLAVEEARDELADRRAQYDGQLAAQAVEETWEREITGAAVERSRKRWGGTFQAGLAAAALACVVGVASWNQSRSTAGEEIAAQWEVAVDHEMAALTRVAELQAEIDRRVSLSDSERLLLEEQLRGAQQNLAAAEEAKDEVDRRRPQRPASPSKLATLPSVKTKPQATPAHGGTPPETGSVKVAADEATGNATAACPTTPSASGSESKLLFLGARGRTHLVTGFAYRAPIYIARLR